MFFKNEEEFLDYINRCQKILYMIFKIIFIIIFAIYVYQIINQINLSIDKNKGSNAINNILNIGNSNININSFNNSIANQNNNIPDIYNNNLQSIIFYENVFFNSFQIFKNLRNKFFSLSYLSYNFSREFDMVKMEYIIGIYDQDKTLLIPSDLALYQNLHFVCFIEGIISTPPPRAGGDDINPDELPF